MFDPAVLGTLLIQLREDVDPPTRRGRPSRRPQRRRPGIGLGLANVLRRAAVAIEPRAFGPGAGEAGA